MEIFELKRPQFFLSVSSLPQRLFQKALVLLALLACAVILIWPEEPPIPTVVLPPSSSSTPPRILLVSAFFPLEHAKHSHEEYRSWLNNFLGHDGVHGDIYFYTTPELEPLVRSLWSASKAVRHRLTINTQYDTPFAVPPLSSYREKYIRMHNWDRERAIHNPELYAVWNAKPWLLESAVIVHENEYDYAFWVDAGSFRDVHPFRAWPDPVRIQEIFSVTKEKDMVLFPLYQLPDQVKSTTWRDENGPLDIDFSEGSFFGSTPLGISWFAKTFYEAHDRYINTQPPSTLYWWNSAIKLIDDRSTIIPEFHFVGKDQTLFNALLFRFPSRFLGVLAPSRMPQLPPQRKSPSQPWNACGDRFYYQWWLATPHERNLAKDMGWTHCGETGTGVIIIDGLLRSMFGSEWVDARRAPVVPHRLRSREVTLAPMNT